MFDAEIAAYVKPYTIVGEDRLNQLLKGIEYVEFNNIPGDYIEIGVLRGGCIIAMILKLIQLGKKRKIHLYDTFSGMTAPTEHDVDYQGNPGIDVCGLPNLLCSLENVKSNIDNVLKNYGYPSELIEYHVGDICKTPIEKIPKQIALLRLDTDFYESTKFELDYFEPNLSENNGKHGMVIIDDYGHWNGCRKAVDEFLLKNNRIIRKIDYTGIYFTKL